MSRSDDAATGGVNHAAVLILHQERDAAAAEELRNALADHGAYALPAPYDQLTSDRPRFDLVVVVMSTEADALQLMMMSVSSPTVERMVFVLLDADLIARSQGRKRPRWLDGTTSGGMSRVARQLVGSWARPEWPARDSAGSRKLASLAKEAQDSIEETLSDLDAHWEREPAIAGLRPDYLVQLPDDRRIVIEVKARVHLNALDVVAVFTVPHLNQNLSGAIGYLDLLAEATGADLGV